MPDNRTQHRKNEWVNLLRLKNRDENGHVSPGKPYNKTIKGFLVTKQFIVSNFHFKFSFLSPNTCTHNELILNCSQKWRSCGYEWPCCLDVSAPWQTDELYSASGTVCQKRPTMLHSWTATMNQLVYQKEINRQLFLIINHFSGINVEHVQVSSS